MYIMPLTHLSFALLLTALNFSHPHATLWVNLSVCRFVGRSVGQSVGRSVTQWEFKPKSGLTFCNAPAQCPPIRDWCCCVYGLVLDEIRFTFFPWPILCKFEEISRYDEPWNKTLIFIYILIWKGSRFGQNELSKGKVMKKNAVPDGKALLFSRMQLNVTMLVF